MAAPRSIAALIAGVICVVLLVGTFGLAYAWLCALAFAALALVLIDMGLNGEFRPLPVAVAGICFGLALGARLDMSLAIFLVCVVLATNRRECLAWLLLGMVVGLTPLFVNVGRQVSQP